MKRLAPVALALLLASGAYAQRGGGRGGFGGGGRGGFGGGGFGRGGGFVHGGAGRGGFVHGGFGRGGFVRGHVGGFRGSISFRSGFGLRNPLFFNRSLSHRAFFNRGFGGGFGGFGFGGFGGFGVPYAWPIYVGGVYTNDPFYDYPYYPAQPNITVIGAPYAAEPAPPVVITQAYAPPPPPPSPIVRPSIREYGPPEREPEPAGETAATAAPQIYLVAFKDGVIRPALAYWVDGGTLHYVGRDRKQYQAPLTSLDREFSLQLNRERRVPFRLPEP